jgi:hypothetical protein
VREIRCVVAVDEAHHYLRRRCGPLLELLRVGRSKGVPVVLSSQSLSDFRGYTETDELFGSSLLLGHGKPVDARSLQGALGLPAAEAARAAERVCTLDQFFALAPSDGGPLPASPVRLHAFFEGRYRP